MPLFNSYLRDYPAALPPYQASLAISVPMLIPAIIGALELRAHSVFYTQDSAFGAVQALREIQVSVILGNSRLDDIYRLLDKGINGTIYEEISPGVIEPPIPAVPTPFFQTISILGGVNTNQAAWYNLLNGEDVTGDFTDTRNIRQQLDDILAALQADDTLDESQIELLQQILLAIGAVV